MKKRILVLLSVVALMVVMLAMAVAPAFATQPIYVCTYTNAGGYILTDPHGAHEFERDGLGTCERVPKRHP